jgi:hypothetical protein
VNPKETRWFECNDHGIPMSPEAWPSCFTLSQKLTKLRVLATWREIDPDPEKKILAQRRKDAKVRHQIKNGKGGAFASLATWREIDPDPEMNILAQRRKARQVRRNKKIFFFAAWRDKVS